MPYIGNTSPSRFVSNRAASVYSGDGSTTAFTLEQAVVQDEDILVSVDGVVQEPSVAYAVSNATTLTFTAAPSSNSGNNIFVYYLASQVGTVGHPSNQALSASTGTFTGDLTVDTDTLKVDATNDLVGINTATPSDMYYNELVVNSGDEGGITILDTSSGQSALAFADGTSGNARYRGRILYDHNTDSLSIGTAGEQYWTMNSAHIITTPKQPAFLAVPNSGSGGTTNMSTNTTIAFGTEKFDQNGDFASNTFTAPVTGKYQLNFMARVDQIDTAANWQRLVLVTSNTIYESQIIDLGGLSGDPTYWSFNINVLADMDANDTAFIKYQQDAGAAQTDVTEQAFFSGFLAC